MILTVPLDQRREMACGLGVGHGQQEQAEGFYAASADAQPAARPGRGGASRAGLPCPDHVHAQQGGLERLVVNHGVGGQAPIVVFSPDAGRCRTRRGGAAHRTADDPVAHQRVNEDMNLQHRSPIRFVGQLSSIVGRRP